VGLSVYDAEKIIQSLYEGLSLRKTLEEQRIDAHAFFDLVDSNPNLTQQYSRAQASRAELLADDIVTIADTDLDPQRARNRITARQWYASKMQPQKYGERIELNVNQTVDIGSALAEARRRALPSSDPLSTNQTQLIDVTPRIANVETDTASVPTEPYPENEPIDPFS